MPLLGEPLLLDGPAACPSASVAPSCPGLKRHQIVRWRRRPQHPENPPRRTSAELRKHDAPHAARRRGDSPPCLPESFRPSGSRGWCGPVSIRNSNPNSATASFTPAARVITPRRTVIRTMDSNHSRNHGGRSAVASETAVLAGPIALPGKSSQTDIAPRVMPGFQEGDRGGIVRLMRLDPKHLQSRTLRLQGDATRPGRRLGRV